MTTLTKKLELYKTVFAQGQGLNFCNKVNEFELITGKSVRSPTQTYLAMYVDTFESTFARYILEKMWERLLINQNINKAKFHSVSVGVAWGQYTLTKWFVYTALRSYLSTISSFHFLFCTRSGNSFYEVKILLCKNFHFYLIERNLKVEIKVAIKSENCWY